MINQDKLKPDHTLKTLEQTIQQEYGNIVGIVAQKNGEVLLEKYFHGYAPQDAVHVFSVTKSVFSALIGIAVDQGMIKSIEQKVLDFFPRYKVKRGEETIKEITIKHLLTMTAPYKYKEEPYEDFFASQNPVQDALDYLGGEESPGEFRYAAIGGPHILSGILTAAAGRSALDFAVENLFGPLGIPVTKRMMLKSREEHIDVMSHNKTNGWVVDPQGNPMAGWGLFLTPLEMAKIGQLYLNDGVWDGKQILPAWWIAESTREQSLCGQGNGPGYGYLWWVIDGDSYGAMGDGGNTIYVNKKKKMVVSISGLMTPEAKPPIGFIKKYVEQL